MLLDVEITYLILCGVAGGELNEHTDFFSLTFSAYFNFNSC